MRCLLACPAPRSAFFPPPTQLVFYLVYGCSPQNATKFQVRSEASPVFNFLDTAMEVQQNLKGEGMIDNSNNMPSNGCESTPNAEPATENRTTNGTEQVSFNAVFQKGILPSEHNDVPFSVVGGMESPVSGESKDKSSSVQITEALVGNSGGVSSSSETAISETSSALLPATETLISLKNGSQSLADRDQDSGMEMDALLEEEKERLDGLNLSNGDSLETSEKAKEMDKEHQYKRLIELLTKSQFYTDFLVKKLEGEASKKVPKKRGKRKLKESTDSDPEEEKIFSSSPSKKVQKSGSEQVMAIAADVICNKKLSDEAVEEDTNNEEPDPSLTKTLENGLIVPLSQPALLTGACLRDYQMEGLNWLKLLFENGVNGILADEMGLGKTIQVIALIAHLVEKNIRGPFLIIGPLSTLPNWTIEFERFAPQIPVVVYHGSEEKRIEARKVMTRKQIVKGRKVYPIVITSYEYPLRDMNVLKKFNWRYIIIDEGHRIKNHNSQLSRALRKYTSANRLLLTGTPLHNSLSELWALLNFLVPEIFDDLEIFESWFKVTDLSSEDGDEKLMEEEKKKKILSTMHKILSPFMLRRIKTQVDLNLPPKKELIVYAPMTPIQVDLYRAVLDFNISKLKDIRDESSLVDEDGKRLKRTCTTNQKFYNLNKLFRLEDEMEAMGPTFDDKKTLVVQDKENKNYAIRVKMNNTAMMMRKIVNHPYLIQYPLEPGTEYARIDEDLVKTSGKLQVLDAMLTKLSERGHKVLLFSTFTSLIDILEDYLSLRTFKYVRLDGGTSLEDRQTCIKEFNNNPELFLFLISTRAGGLGINLASADTVIIYDSDWNPQVDLQAQDRCHRIGQTRPVVVYRFVTAGTVDEKIVVRASTKRKLEKLIIHKGNYSAFQKRDDNIDLKELETLLKSCDHQGVIHPNGFVFSDEELNELLDRSKMMEGKISSSSKDVDIQARPFKEYYGYTGKKENSCCDETNSNVQIVDQDSNDAPCEDVVVKRSPFKKNNSMTGIISSHSMDLDVPVESSSRDHVKKDLNVEEMKRSSRKRPAEQAAIHSKNSKVAKVKPCVTSSRRRQSST